VIAREKADLNLRLAACRLDQRAERRGRVDDRVCVRHRKDRAEATRGRRSRATRDRLLVLASRRPQVHVRIDERGGEYETGRVDDAMVVRVDLQRDRCDGAVVDAHVEHRVHAFDRVDDARTAHDDVLLGCVLGEEHHATSNTDSVLTSIGPLVSRS